MDTSVTANGVRWGVAFEGMTCLNRAHAIDCPCKAGGDRELRATVALEDFFVGQPLTLAPLAVCDVCGEAEARRLFDDGQAICDDCWHRALEDREDDD